MTLLADFQRVTRSRPCPLCNRIKYCMIDRADPANPARVICTKVESGKRWGEAGYLHVLRRDERDRRPACRPRQVTVAVTVGAGAFTDLAGRFQAAVDAAGLVRFASTLGLSTESLTRLDIGWASADALAAHGTTCRGAGAWTFPMRDGEGRVVGIRLRTDDGFKYAVNGSHQGLFVPTDLGGQDRLFITEGPTDTAAVLDLGYWAVGRPSCTGGMRAAAQLVQRLLPTGVVVLADNDEPGLRGAKALASVLAAFTGGVRVIRPPERIKDARAWVTRCPTCDAVRSQIDSAIENAAPYRVRVASGRTNR